MSSLLGDIFGRALASAVDSVLKDAGKEVRKVDRKIRKTRVEIQTIKEESYHGRSETSDSEDPQRR